MKVFTENPFGKDSRCQLIELNSRDSSIKYGIEYGIGKMTEVEVSFPDRESENKFMMAFESHFETSRRNSYSAIAELVCPYEFLKIAYENGGSNGQLILKHMATLNLMQPYFLIPLELGVRYDANPSTFMSNRLMIQANENIKSSSIKTPSNSL